MFKHCLQTTFLMTVEGAKMCKQVHVRKRVSLGEFRTSPFGTQTRSGAHAEKLHSTNIINSSNDRARNLSVGILEKNGCGQVNFENLEFILVDHNYISDIHIVWFEELISCIWIP